MNLPKNARVNKFIAKTKFYQKAALSPKLQTEFIQKIQKITWKYKLAENTIGIPKTSSVTEIQIFEIALKEKTIPKNVLKVIDKAIPYPILYHFVYQSHIAWGITLKGQVLKNRTEKESTANYYFSEWNENLDFDFSGNDLEIVYQKLIQAFVREEAKSRDHFDAIIEADNRIKRLEKEIGTLSKKIQKEKQFNRKVDLNKSLLEKQKQLKDIRFAFNSGH